MSLESILIVFNTIKDLRAAVMELFVQQWACWNSSRWCLWGRHRAYSVGWGEVQGGREFPAGVQPCWVGASRLLPRWRCGCTLWERRKYQWHYCSSFSLRYFLGLYQEFLKTWLLGFQINGSTFWWKTLLQFIRKTLKVKRDFSSTIKEPLKSV